MASREGLPPAQVGKVPIGVETDQTGESPAVGYGLVDSTEFGGDPVTLASLTDVDISSPADGQGLVYNADTGKWEPLDLAGSSGPGELFSLDAIASLQPNFTVDNTYKPNYEIGGELVIGDSIYRASAPAVSAGTDVHFATINADYIAPIFVQAAANIWNSTDYSLVIPAVVKIQTSSPGHLVVTPLADIDAADWEIDVFSLRVPLL